MSRPSSPHHAATRMPPPGLPWLPVSAISRIMARWKRSLWWCLQAPHEAKIIAVVRRGQFAREAPDDRGREAGDRGGLLGRVLGEALAQPFEDGAHLDFRTPRQLHFVVSRRGRAQGSERERTPSVAVALAARHRGDAARRLVPEIEEVVAAAGLEVRFAQEALVVLAHQDREIGLLADVLRVVEILGR